MQTIINQPIREIQFFLFLNILILENASLNICLAVGIIKSPFSFSQP